MAQKKEASINFKLKQEDRAYIDEIAKAEDRKVGFIVRNLVLDYLDAKQHKKTTKNTIGTQYLLRICDYAMRKNTDFHDYSIGAYDLDLILDIINNNNIKLTFDLVTDTSNIIKHSNKK